MSVKRRLVVEERPGEVRAAILDADGTPLEFAVERDHSASMAGAMFVGRIKALRPEIGAAFVDIGAGEEGFLNVSKKDNGLTVGAAVAVVVDRDATANKGPRLKRIDTDVDSDADAPVMLSPPPGLAERCMAAEPDAAWELISDQQGNAFQANGLEDTFEDALSPVMGLPGGGRLIFAETPAMTTIDVDAGAHMASGQARLAREVNLAAAAAIGPALRLRRIGGIVAVDFLKMSAPKDRDMVLKTLKAAFKDDPTEVQVGVFSPFGVVELQRQRMGPSLAEMFVTPSAHLNDEATALAALNALCKSRGGPAALALPAGSAALLGGALACAKASAEERLGFDIEVRSVAHLQPGTFSIEEPTRK